MKIGPLIAAYREKHGINIRDMARQIGVQIGTLSRIENGKSCNGETVALIFRWLVER